MKKIFYSIISLMLVISLVGCSVAREKNGKNITAGTQKELERIARYEDAIPKDYQYFDYKERAMKFDDVLFTKTPKGPYLPLMWEDTTYHTFGIPAYVGDGRMSEDGEQEAVTVIASVLSATQLGIDKSNQNGKDYVSLLSAFFSEEEKIILNNPTGKSKTTSMWYLIYPAILFSQVSILYPEEAVIREEALATIESWYQACRILLGTGTFEYTGFDFTKMEPYKNDIWIEPDSAAGMAMLLYYGYELTGNQDYLNTAIEAVLYLNEYQGSPMYEVLLYFAPYLAAMFNAAQGTDINVEDLLNDMLNGNSIPRGGWGSMAGSWGDYCVNGLMGSTSDGGGYAFAMNTFTAAYALSPLVKYDSKYANTIGKWYLNVVGNARYFFTDQTNEENQSKTKDTYAQEFSELVENAVPYEGIRKSSNSKTPWFGGDPTVYGWALTDFSLYSGAHVGLLGSVIEKTDVEAILKVNLNKADLFHQEYPSYLMYNPYKENKTLNYVIASDKTVNLYDNITKRYLLENVSGEVQIEIPAQNSVVLVEIPVLESISHENKAYKVGSTVIGGDTMTVWISNYAPLDKVSGDFKLEAEVFSTVENDSVKEVNVTINDKTIHADSLDKLDFSVDELGTGSKNFIIEVVMSSGLRDQKAIRLLLE